MSKTFNKKKIYDDKVRLKNKVTIITGSTSGIGKAAAILFAKEGAKVIVNGRRKRLGKKVVDKIIQEGGEATYIYGDLTKEEDVKNLIKQTIKKYGKIDVLYNNAGEELSRSITEASNKEWDLMINTNLKSVFLTMKHAIPHMKKGGSIINTASMAVLYGLPLHSIYGASKGGIVGLTINTAADYAKKGIRINCICPGPTWTPMVKKHVPKFLPDSAVKWFIKKLVPMNRFAEAEEIAKVALFLASDDSSFITGAIIPVDGGATSFASLSNMNYGRFIKK